MGIREEIGAGRIVTPFAPSADWWRRYLRLRMEGLESPEAAAGASAAAGTKGKDYARSQIAGGVRIGVPVEGGASVLKRGSNPRLSEHGKWRREHLGAWQAAYGRTPYYEHLMPLLERIYAESEREELTLEEFNRRLLRLAESWIAGDGAIASIENERERLQERISETVRKVNGENSIFDAIFRLGKETVFGVI